MRSASARLALICVALIALSGCLPGSKITRRYSGIAILPGVPPPDIKAPKLSAFVMVPPPETAKVTLRDLSDRGQQSLIRELSSLSKDPRDLIANLGLPIRDGLSQQGIIDERKKKRRIVFSIINNMRSPGNRIHRATTILSDLQNGNFTHWNRFSTEYGTVDLGMLGTEQSRSLTGAVKADPRGPLFGEVSVSGTASGKLTESLVMRERYLTISGILQKDSATLHQQGVPGIDLAGNTSIDIDLEVTSQETYAIPSFIVGGSPNEPTVTKVTRVYPYPAATVVARTSLCTEVRAIKRGSKTPHEGDDDAVYQQLPCTTGAAVEIVSGQPPTPISSPPSAPTVLAPLRPTLKTAAPLEPKATEDGTRKPGDSESWLTGAFSSTLTLVTEEDARVTGWTLRGERGAVHIKYLNDQPALLFVTQADAEKALAAMLISKTPAEQNVRFATYELVFKRLQEEIFVKGSDLVNLVIVPQPLNYAVRN